MQQQCGNLSDQGRVLGQIEPVEPVEPIEAVEPEPVMHLNQSDFFPVSISICNRSESNAPDLIMIQLQKLEVSPVAQVGHSKIQSDF